jgi:hypothetical protein
MLKRNRLQLLCVAITLLALFTTGCQASTTATTTTSTTNTITTVYTPYTTVFTDKQISIRPCVDDPEGDISFENVTLAKGILEKDYFTPWAGDHKKGELCFLISGRIVNDSGTRYWVAYFADGLDDAGNRVAGSLDAGTLVGIAKVGIEPRSADEFTLHLGWSENATSFTLHSQKWDQMFP